MPKISVVMLSYNHAEYVGLAAQSVLQQTFGDFELVIVDDGSTDKSREILSGLSDARIKLAFQENQGPSGALNTGIGLARGEYIALMASDDVCHPGRLECELRHLEAEKLDVVFTLPQIVDGQGAPREDADYPVFFGKKFSSSAQLLRLFFHHGNFLCAPTAFIRTATLLRAGPFRLGALQLQDFDMWVRLCGIAKIGLIGDRLLSYRVHERNLSGRAGQVACRFEQLSIYRSFFDGVPVSILREAFPGLIAPDATWTDRELEAEKSFVYLSHHDSLIRSIGAERLYRQLDEPETLELLESRWGFGPREFHRLVVTLDAQNARERDGRRIRVSKSSQDVRAED